VRLMSIYCWGTWLCRRWKYFFRQHFIRFVHFRRLYKNQLVTAHSLNLTHTLSLNRCDTKFSTRPTSGSLSVVGARARTLCMQYCSCSVARAGHLRGILLFTI
jgi:hypothetical protein